MSHISAPASRHLKWQVISGFALALGIVTGLAYVSLRSTWRLAQYSDAATQDYEVLAQLNRAMALVTDVETGLRGYVITGDEAFLEPYHSAVAAVHEPLDRLRALSSEVPSQRENLQRLESLIEARIAIAASVIAQRRARGFAAAQRGVVEAGGKQTQDLIRALISSIEAERTYGLQERELLRQQTARRSIGLVALGGLLAFVVVGVAMALARRGFLAQQRADAQLRHSNDELRLATEQAQAADRLKSAFLATMSHELRTPLNSVIGFTGVMLQELPGPLNAEQAKQLGMVQDSARHLLALINDVLDISKIEAGEMRLQGEPFDLRAAAVKVTDLISPLAAQKGLTLRVQLAPDLGSASGDRRRTEQVLLNLLNNAVKFTEQGEVALTAEATHDLVRFRVSDTGIGITPKDANHLFMPFRQVDTGLAREYEGTGLGLAISRRLAVMMGGDIRVESTVGRGSVFTFEIPRRVPEHP